MISNAACKTTVWHSRQRHWKTGEMGAGGSTSAATTGAGPRQCGLLTDFRGISGKPDNAANRYVNAQSGAAEARTTGAGFTLTGCTSPVADQDRRRWRISTACRARSGTTIFRSWLNRLQNDRVLETANRLRENGKEAEAEALLRQQPPSSY